MQGGSNYGNATDFFNTSTTWVPDGGLDVHWATERVFDFWSNVMGRNSYDGAGSTLVGFAHTLLTGLGFSNNDNAFWDPTNHRMTYGDGGSEMRTVVSLDVIAHEIGHGICQYTANLDNSGEAAALNEGLSDIWAACVEHYAAPAKDNWLIGEEIMLFAPSLRSLRDPINESARPCPDRYQGPNWSTAGGSVESHTNCTVLGHWFFLLCQGGSGTNIGIENAQQIVYQMERYHMDHNATYTTTRAGAIQAARELFGVNSCQEAAVTNAWFAVGVGDAYSSTWYPPVTINGPISICTNQSATYTLSNVPPYAKFTWTIGTPNATIVPAADGLSAVVTNNGTAANSSTSVQVSYGGCPANILSAKNIALSAAWPVGIASYSNATYCEPNCFILMAGGGSYAYNMQLYVSAFGATSYSWTEISNSGPMYWSNVSSSGVTVGSKRNTSKLILKVTASNACGSVSQQYGFQFICNPVRMVTSADNPNGNVTDQSLAIFPNPTTDKLTITLPNDVLATHAEIKISDIYGRPVQRLKTISATTTTSMLGLPSGMYIVEVITGNKTVMMKKIVKK
jgi:bacillolysin